MGSTADGGTILVVEDDPILNQALATALKIAGFRAVAVRSAAEGLRAFAVAAPDLVLLDLSGRGGLTMVSEIRARGATPIIVLAPGRAKALSEAALELGADGCLAKPFGQDALLERLRARLDPPRAA